MKKTTTSIIAKLITGIMSILVAINVAAPAVTTAQKAKVKATYNPLPTVEEIKANANNRNNNLEIVEDETPAFADETPEDANNEQAPEAVEPADENIYNDENVLEVIDISATKNDNVTLKVYAAPKKEAAAKTNITFYENQVATASDDDDAAAVEVTAVITGTGKMEENVYRHFVDADQFVEAICGLLADEYDLEEVTHSAIPEGVTDIFEIDRLVSYYGPDGEELDITDEVRDAINPGAMLKYSPDYIAIENGIESVSDGAFLFCGELRGIELPASVKTIGKSAFAYCTNLETVVLNNGLTTIGEGAFMHCRSLKEITFPATLKAIEPEAFENCTQLSKVVFNEGLERIGAAAFMNCSSFKEINLPRTITFVGYQAFAYVNDDFVINCQPAVYNILTANFALTPGVTTSTTITKGK